MRGARFSASEKSNAELALTQALLRLADPFPRRSCGASLGPTPHIFPMNDPEVIIANDYLSKPNADVLFHALVNEIAWDDRMKARKTACFGQTYDDSGVDYDVKPMHALLVPLCEGLRRTLGFEPTNCLLNYYETGRSSMGFHSDATYNLEKGTGIAILSLGAERLLTFRSKADPVDLRHFSLPHGSLLYMTQQTQDFWAHAVKKSDTDDARISATFRRILPPPLAAR
jgi:hypothetical protein